MKFSDIIYSATATALLGLLATACTEVNPVTNPPVNNDPVVIERGTFAKGADVSWVTELESQALPLCTAMVPKRDRWHGRRPTAA